MCLCARVYAFGRAFMLRFFANSQIDQPCKVPIVEYTAAAATAAAATAAFTAAAIVAVEMLQRPQARKGMKQ